MSDRDLTVKEVSQELRASKQTVYALIKAGDLHAYRLSTNGTRVRREDLDRFKTEKLIAARDE